MAVPRHAWPAWPAYVLLGVLALAGWVAAPAAAQGHGHGAASGIAIAHDVPPDGRTYVGNVNHFAVIAHGGDGVPDFHQDVPWRVSLNGAVLAATTTLSGHDYDGVNQFAVVFPATGEYEVEALGPGGEALAAFHGYVVPAPEGPSGASLDGAAVALAGQPETYTFHAHGGRPELADEPIPHSDCSFEALREGRLEFRTKTHTHEDRQAVTYAFAGPGSYVVRITCFQAYPSPRATLFPPVVLERPVEVLPGAPSPVVPPLAPVPHPAALNAVATAAAGGMQLVGTYDPYTVVGPFTLQRLNVLAIDPATLAPIQHVDFTATLDGPAGRIFSSTTLHEYDGILEVATRQSVPGPYTLRVTAEGAAGSGELAMTYLVAPPVVPLTAGLVDVALDAPAPATTGVAADWLLTATATSGPFAHGELDVRLTASGADVPWLQAKLHTHGDGTFPWTVALPAPGTYELAVDPFPLTPDAVLPALASFRVEAAAAGETAHGSDSAAAASREAPGQSIALAGVALAGALLLAAGRRRA